MADAAIERAFAGAKNLIGRLFAVGGSSWAVTRLSGDGLASPRTSGPAGEVTGWLTQGAARPGVAVVGEVVPPVAWTFTRTGGLPLQPGDELEEVGGVRVRVGVLLDTLGYEEWEVTRL